MIRVQIISSGKKTIPAKSACVTGKIKHTSISSAQYVFDRMGGNKDKKSHLLEIYKCQFCKMFHIGHNKAK